MNIYLVKLETYTRIYTKCYKAENEAHALYLAWTDNHRNYTGLKVSVVDKC